MTEPSETILPAITITDSARKQILRVLEKKDMLGAYIRLGVRGGGCSGLSYILKPEAELDEFDQVWNEPDGVRVVVDSKSLVFLQGTTLDYSMKNLLEGGFKFDNPNAVKSCGCGTSFTPR